MSVPDPAEVRPQVTVIVPFRDAEATLAGCLTALASQTYPAPLTEILAVDNGSTDGSRAVAERFPSVRVLVEARPGSYAARNRALSVASGEVLAFCDADCVPAASWLEEGVRTLQAEEADLVGGRVRFVLSEPPTGAQLYDAITNMQVDENIDRGTAKTANLFVRRRVVDEIGPFPTVLSGGDVAWTATATRRGYRLVYSRDAVVSHPARRLRELLAKQARVGSGQAVAWRHEGLDRTGTLRRMVRWSVPRSPAVIRARLEERQLPASSVAVARAWFAGVLAVLATTAGRVVVLRRSRPDGSSSEVEEGSP